MPRIALLLALAAIVLAGCGTSDPDPSASASAGYLPVPDVVGLDARDAAEQVRNKLMDPVFRNRPDRTSLGDCTVAEQTPTSEEWGSQHDEVTLQLTCAHSAASSSPKRPTTTDAPSAPSAPTTTTESDAATTPTVPADPEGFDAAYAAGFAKGCRQLFAATPDGQLFASNQAYTADDCAALAPTDLSTVADLPTERTTKSGTKAGKRDGCLALFEAENVNGFGAGSLVVTRGDCPTA